VSVPGPVSDPDQDWFWWGVQTVSSGDEGTINANSLFQQQVIDSRAMRKVKPSETIVFVIEIDRSQDQGGSVNVMYSVCILAGA